MDPVFPDLPVGLSASTHQWITDHKAEWHEWELQAEAHAPVATYLDCLRKIGDVRECPASKTRRLLEEAATSGLSEARLTLGLWLLNQPSRPDKLIGLTWIREAAFRGFAPAQWEMAKAYHDGTLLPHDPLEEARYVSLAAERGVEHALRRAAELSVIGLLNVDDIELQLDGLQAHDRFTRCALGSVFARASNSEKRNNGRRLLESAFNEGIPEAATQLGLSYLDTSEELGADLKLAVEWLEKANAAGDNTAALFLARLFRAPGTLDITAHDAQIRHIRALEAASARSDAQAQHRLAMLIESSDPKRALELLKASSTGGYQPAWADQLRLRHRETASAVEDELRIAAARHDPYASLVLGELISSGRVPGTFSESFRLAKTAYEALDSPRAALVMGRYYADVEGEQCNPVEATRWFFIAALDPDDPQIEAIHFLRDAHSRGFGVPTNPEMVQFFEARTRELADE